MRVQGRHDSGQATVELALVLPVLMLVLFGILQVSALARDRVAVIHATRDGARTAVVDPTESAVGHAVARSTTLDRRRLRVELRGGTDPGDLVTVVVHYRSPTDAPLIGALLPDVELTEELVAVVE